MRHLTNPVLRRVAAVVVAAAGGVLTALSLPAAGGQEKTPPPNAYIGATKCKNCHEAKAKGSQFSTWKEAKHSKTFEVLGGDEAKKIAKEKGIADPQQAAECLKCHVTGHGEPAERIAKGFDPKLGVQCESCHGPGEVHFKARMKAAAKIKPGDEAKLVKIPEDEIVRQPQPATCLKCHNEESPQFKPFCFKKRFAEIAHLDPRKKRSEAELAAMKCACEGECKCTKCDCGGLHDEKKPAAGGGGSGDAKAGK